MKSFSRASRRIGALVVVALIVVALPLAMSATFGTPWSWGVPTVDAITEVLTAPMGPGLMVRIIGFVAWLAWLHFSLCLVVEVINVIARQGKPQLRLPGGGVNQHLARRLVAAALLSGVAGAAMVGPASAAPTVDRTQVSATVVESPVVVEHQSGPSTASATAQESLWQSTQTAEPVASTLQSYTVHAPDRAEHDCLWDIAERHLGDPLRWKEIYDLNNSHPSGTKISDPDLIQPGWTLVMPADAVGLPTAPQVNEETPEPHTPAVAADVQTPASAPQQDNADAEALPEVHREVATQQGGVSVAGPDGQAHQGYDDGGMSREMYEELESKMRIPTPPPGTFDEEPQQFSLSELADAGLNPQATADALAPLAQKYPDLVESASTVEEAVNNADVARSLAGGLGAVAASGLLLALVRRRQATTRTRTGNQRLRLPAALASHLETDLRALNDAKPVDEIVLILQELARLARASDVPVPPATMVTFTADDVEIYCSSPTAPLAPWRSEGNSPLRWTAPRSAFENIKPTADTTPYPQLLSLGHLPNGTMVLVNLAELGTLTLTGDSDKQVEGMLAAAVELVTAPWSREGTVAFFGVDLDLGDLTQNYRVSLVRDFETLVADLTKRADDWDAHQADSTQTGNVAELHTVLVGCDLPLGPRQKLAKLAERLQGSGVSVVALGQEPLGSWAVNFATGAKRSQSHNATLVPTGLALQAHTMPVEMLPVVKELFTVEVEEHTEGATQTCPVGQRFPGAGLAASIGTAPDITRQERLTIQLVGQPSISGAHGPQPFADSVDHSADVVELIAYLSLRSGPVSFTDIQNDLRSLTGPWSESTIRERARMAKSWLGSADDGHDLVKIMPGAVELAGAGEIRNQLFALMKTVDAQNPQSVLSAAEIDVLLENVTDELVTADQVTGAYAWFEPIRIRVCEAIVNSVAQSIPSLLASGHTAQARHSSRIARILDPVSELAWIASFDVESTIGDPQSRAELLQGYRESVAAFGGKPGPELSARLQAIVAENGQVAMSQNHSGRRQPDPVTQPVELVMPDTTQHQPHQAQEPIQPLRPVG